MIKVEIFASEPPCSSGRLLMKLIDNIRNEYIGRAEFEIIYGEDGKTKEYGILTTPAIVVDEDIRIISVCPSEETLRNAFFEAGM